jgi:nicotinamidase/pyrazinamidase
MIEGPLVFVDIDTQRDFLEPRGALFVRGSEGILGNLARLSEFARRTGIPVLASACSHTTDDPEIAQLGEHCMAGSPGQARIEATAWAGDKARVARPSESVACSGPVPAHLTLEKREFDLFSHPAADRVVEWYNRDRPTFVVYGVATDYCVKSAVVGLLERGCRVFVVVDAIRAIDTDHEADVLALFVQRGAVLTLTDVVCGS